MHKYLRAIGFSACHTRKEEEELKEKQLEKAESLEKLLEKIKEKRAETETSLSEKLQEDGKGMQMDLTI